MPSSTTSFVLKDWDPQGDDIGKKIGVDIANGAHHGIVISKVYSGGRALQAGLQEGYVITGVNDIPNAKIPQLGASPDYIAFAEYVRHLPGPLTLNFNDFVYLDEDEEQQRAVTLLDGKSRLADLMFQLLDINSRGHVDEIELRKAIGNQTDDFMAAAGVQPGEQVTGPSFIAWAVPKIIELLPKDFLASNNEELSEIQKISSIFSVALIMKNVAGGSGMGEELFACLEKNPQGHLDLVQPVCAEKRAMVFFKKMAKSMGSKENAVTKQMFTAYVIANTQECTKMLKRIESESRRGVFDLCGSTASDHLQ